MQPGLVRREDHHDLREFLAEGREVDHLDPLREAGRGGIVVAREEGGDRVAAQCRAVRGEERIVGGGAHGERAQGTGEKTSHRNGIRKKAAS